MQTVNITSQWQVYIPWKVREDLGLEKPGRAKVSVKAGKIIIKPIGSLILKRAGFLEGVKPKRKVEPGKERDIIDYSGL